MASLAVVGIAVLALLTLTAVGARDLPGTTRSLALSWTVDVIQVIQIGVGVLIVGALLWGLLHARRGATEERPKRRRSRPRRQSALAVLLVLAALAALVWLIPRPENLELDESAPSFTISEVDFPPLEDVGAAWPLLVLVATAAIAIFAVSMLTRSQEEEVDEVDAGALLADSLTDALDALSWSEDPRSVIIKAYHDIETALAVAGLPRRASEAPREYLERVLANAGVRPGSITRLTTLFELARFSDRDLGESDRTEAEAALQSALADLGVAAP